MAAPGRTASAAAEARRYRLRQDRLQDNAVHQFQGSRRYSSEAAIGSRPPGRFLRQSPILLSASQNRAVSPIVQQLLTLLGVVLGAGATFTATTFAERAKWRRSQDTRWDERRLTAYTEYANALKRYVQIAYRMAATQGYPTAADPIDLEVGAQALTDANVDRSVRWETVLLLGSPSAVQAGRAWHQAAWKYSWVVRGQRIDRAEYLRLYEEMGRRRDDFYTSARSDLGVSSGVLPSGDQVWLPPSGDAEAPS